MSKNTGFEVAGLDIEGMDEDGNPTGYIVTTKSGKKTTLKPEQFGLRFREANQEMLIDAVSRYKNNPPKQIEPVVAKVKSTTQAAAEGQSQVMDQPETGEGNAPVNDPNADVNVNVDAAPPATASVAPIELTDSSTTKQTTTEQVITPAENMRALQDSFQAQQKAKKTVADAATAQAAAEGALYTQQAMELNEQNDAMVARRTQKENEFETMLKLSSELVGELRDAKVDPNRFWNEGSTGRKIGAAVSILLGGLGQALTGSQTNAAWEIINSAIDRDIEAQKAAIKAADLAAGRANEIISQLRQKQYSDAEIDKLFRLHKLQELEAQMSAVAAASRIPEVQARYQENLAKLQAEQAALEIDLQKQTQRIVETNTTDTKQVIPKLGKDARENLPEGLRKEVDKAEESYLLMERLYNTFSNPDLQEDMGAVEGRIRDFLMAKGVSPVLGFGEMDQERAAELAKTYAQQRSTLARYLRAMSGAATTDIERQFYAEFFPGIGKNPELSEALAEEMYNQAREEYERKRNQAILESQRAPVGQVFKAPKQPKNKIKERKVGP